MFQIFGIQRSNWIPLRFVLSLGLIDGIKRVRIMIDISGYGDMFAYEEADG